MKNKQDRFQFNAVLNKEDYDTIQVLRKEYGVNISGCIKTFLRQYLKQLKNGKINMGTK